MNNSTSLSLFNQSLEKIPGGVNSPVRAFKSVGGTPLFMKSAKGSKLYDEDGNEYIDLINSWGPMILGHSHPDIIKSVMEAVQQGLSFGTPGRRELEIAELITDMVPGVEKVRMVNSGTEATMSAIRLARGFTGKDKIIKFDGCYHGHGDSFLIAAGSGAATLGVPDSPGVTRGTASDTLLAIYNDLGSVEKIMEDNKGTIAALIVEPVAGNMGCVPPAEGFLKGLRDLCDQHNILLIFDEVMTGFRLSPGGVQELFGITADIVTFGKIIGGGMPVGAYGGKSEIMNQVAPSGPVYQAGTLSGNPVAMAAGIAMLKQLKDNAALYEELDKTTRLLSGSISDILNKYGIDHVINQIGSMFSVFFTKNPVVDFNTAAQSDKSTFVSFFNTMINNGVYYPPSPFESAFVSTEIKEEEINKIVHNVEVFAVQYTKKK